MLILWPVLQFVTLRNGSLWADIFLTRDGANPDPRNPSFNPARIHHIRKRMFNWVTYQDTDANGSGAVLTPYLPRLKTRKEKNLLKGHGEDEIGEVEEVLLDDSPLLQQYF